MHPRHDGVAVARPSQPQRLAPYLPLLLLQLAQLLFFRLFAALVELPLPRRPPALAALVQELGAVLLEHRHGVQVEFVVLGEQAGAARDDHGGERLVGLQEIFNLLCGNGDQVLLQVLRGVGLEQPFGVDDGGKGLLRQVAGLAALHACQVGLGVVVLGEFGLDVGVDRGYFGLQGGQELGDGLVGAVFHFIPLEVREVVFHGSCGWCWSVGASWASSRYCCATHGHSRPSALGSCPHRLPAGRAASRLPCLPHPCILLPVWQARPLAALGHLGFRS